MIFKLSIEVSIGAMAGLFFAANVCAVFLPWPFYLGLFSLVAVIYNADHWADFSYSRSGQARREISDSEKKIYLFYLFLNILILIPCLILILLDLSLFEFLILTIPGTLTAVHLLIARRPWYLIKELMIAILYAVALWLLPVLRSTESFPLHFFILHLMVILQNLFCISYLDYRMDKEDRFPGLNSILSQENIRVLVYTNTFAGLLFIFSYSIVGSTGFTAGVVFSVLLLFPLASLTENNFPLNSTLFRSISDLIFVLLVLI